jgi:hypothetical protein
MSTVALALDQFSGVLGPRRGSQRAQRARDQAEGQAALRRALQSAPEDCVLIREAFSGAPCLSLELLTPLFPLFDSPSPDVSEELDKELVHRGLCNGINLTVPLLDELPRAVRQRLLGLACDYLRGHSPHVPHDEMWVNGAALSLLRALEEPVLDHPEDYEGLVAAMASVLRTDEDMRGAQQCYGSLARTLALQPDERLGLCRPLFDALLFGLSRGGPDAALPYREDQMQTLEGALAPREGESEARAHAFAAVREGLLRLRERTPAPPPPRTGLWGRLRRS